MGSRAGNFRPSLSHNWYGNRWWGGSGWSHTARACSPRDGTHSSATRSEPRSLSRLLPVSRRLPGRLGLWAGHGAALGRARLQFAHRTSRMGTGGTLSRLRSGELGLHLVATPYSARRRSHAAGTAVSHGPWRTHASAEWVRASPRGDGRLGR